MSASIFDNKTIQPDDLLLKQKLGSAKDFIDQIILFVKNEYGHALPEWKFYGQKTGWILKMFNKKRNVLFITPCEGFFRVAFAFGEKAVAEVMESELPESIKTELRNAKKYAEGTGVSVEVKDTQSLEFVLELIRIKLRN